jgi:hypothetical protein
MMLLMKMTMKMMLMKKTLMKMTLMKKTLMKKTLMKKTTTMTLPTKMMLKTTMMTTIKKRIPLVKMMLSVAKVLVRLWRNLRQTRRSVGGTMSKIDIDEHSLMNEILKHAILSLLAIGELHHKCRFFGIL